MTEQNIINHLATYFDLKTLESHWQEDATTIVDLGGSEYTFGTKADVRAAREDLERDLRGLTRALRTD